jgi:hypothetical protein
MMDFKTEKELVEHVRKHGTRDHMKFKGNIFTQDFYDLEGRIITFGNKKTNTTIQISTSNRYKNGFRDAEMIIFEDSGCFDWIDYVE